ncbi:MAG: hypothetical protein A3F13_08880 [Gammaproteobacteria bacterium RIFCSPHIGHO2_12_FULL_40_19]|nr:MAG: hypothetical protein A3F13_08880 [Gammaproteobacteria bacterium RIFCSPHIGHO2_12_FULL_40_19]
MFRKKLSVCLCILTFLENFAAFLLSKTVGMRKHLISYVDGVLQELFLRSSMGRQKTLAFFVLFESRAV